MTLVHISDTHNEHRKLCLPQGDILIHSGDFTFGGSEQEAYDFMDWFCDLPYTHKIFIAGNHDDCLYSAENIEGLPDNVHYLCNSKVTINDIIFYGMPMFMLDCVNGNYDQQVAAIPNNINVLITHQTPFRDFVLMERVKTIHPQFHLFGHEHNEYGYCCINGTIYSNAALMDSKYKFIHQPQVYQI